MTTKHWRPALIRACRVRSSGAIILGAPNYLQAFLSFDFFDVLTTNVAFLEFASIVNSRFGENRWFFFMPHILQKLA